MRTAAPGSPFAVEASRVDGVLRWVHWLSSCPRLVDAGNDVVCQILNRGERAQHSLARLLGAHEVGLIPASFAFHGAQAEPGVVARQIVDPAILAEWSMLWPARAQSAAVARFLDSARRCSTDNGWLPPPDTTVTAETNSLGATAP
jgi:hypothetical protein